MVFLPDFDALVNKTLVSIVNHKLGDSRAVAAYLQEPIELVNRVLDILARKDLIYVSKTVSGDVVIHRVTARGLRAAQNA